MLLALTFALVAQAAPAQPPSLASPAKVRVLVLDLRNDGAKPEHARLVTDNIVVALSRFTQLEVVSSEDVRRMVQTEGEKQSMGCTDDSCLTEIASAMGASLVVHGSIGRLESITVVNLSLYDSKAGKSIGREAIQVQRLDDLPYRVEDATGRLVRPLLGGAPASSASSSSSSGPSTPAPDGPKANRILAGGVAGGFACCFGAGLLLVSALPGINCLVCTLGGGAVALSGGAGPLIGGLIGGAPFSSVLLPAAVGLGVGALVGVTTGTVIAFAVPVPRNGGPSQLLGPTFLGAIPVGVLTGAAAGIATGLLIDDPPAPEASTAAHIERALPNAQPARYAMAY